MKFDILAIHYETVEREWTFKKLKIQPSGDYIPINLISFDTVDFTKCDPRFRIRYYLLSEIDDKVRNKSYKNIF